MVNTHWVAYIFEFNKTLFIVTQFKKNLFQTQITEEEN